MKIKNFRDWLSIFMLLTFFGWLAIVSFWFVPTITSDQLDPVMALVAGLGVGGVTNALIVLLTLTWQFYFRKRTTAEGNGVDNS